MICIRCQRDTAAEIAQAPDGSNAWSIYHCECCNFSWRSTEEASTIDPAQRDPRFQLRPEDLDALISPVPVAALK